MVLVRRSHFRPCSNRGVSAEPRVSRSYRFAKRPLGKGPGKYNRLFALVLLSCRTTSSGPAVQGPNSCMHHAFVSWTSSARIARSLCTGVCFTLSTFTRQAVCPPLLAGNHCTHVPFALLSQRTIRSGRAAFRAAIHLACRQSCPGCHVGPPAGTCQPLTEQSALRLCRFI